MVTTDHDGHPIHHDQPDGVERTHAFGYGPCWCHTDRRHTDRPAMPTPAAEPQPDPDMWTMRWTP